MKSVLEIFPIENFNCCFFGGEFGLHFCFCLQRPGLNPRITSLMLMAGEINLFRVLQYYIVVTIQAMFDHNLQRCAIGPAN
jgi:hypothetical protein